MVLRFSVKVILFQNILMKLMQKVEKSVMQKKFSYIHALDFSDSSDL